MDGTRTHHSMQPQPPILICSLVHPYDSLNMLALTSRLHDDTSATSKSPPLPWENSENSKKKSIKGEGALAPWHGTAAGMPFDSLQLEPMVGGDLPPWGAGSSAAQCSPKRDARPSPSAFRLYPVALRACA